MRSVADIEAEQVAIQKAYLVSCVNSRLEDLEAAATVLRGERVADGVEMYVAAASREVQEAAETLGRLGHAGRGRSPAAPSGVRSLHRPGSGLARGRRSGDFGH